MASRKITLRDFTFSSRQIINDLRALQKKGLTLPDIIYQYRIEEGHLVRKWYREGSVSGDEEAEEDETQHQKDKTRDEFLRAGRESREHELNGAGAGAKGEVVVKIHRKAVPIHPTSSGEMKMVNVALSQEGAPNGRVDDTTQANAKKPRKKVGFGGAEVIPRNEFEIVETVGNPREERKGNFVGEQMSGVVER